VVRVPSEPRQAIGRFIPHWAGAQGPKLPTRGRAPMLLRGWLGTPQDSHGAAPMKPSDLLSLTSILTVLVLALHISLSHERRCKRLSDGR
jgi:hypothetical protein